MRQFVSIIRKYFNKTFNLISLLVQVFLVPNCRHLFSRFDLSWSHRCILNNCKVTLFKTGSFLRQNTLHITLQFFWGLRHSVLLNRTQENVIDKQTTVSRCKTFITTHISGVRVYTNICTYCPENKCGKMYGVVTSIRLK